MDHGQVHLRNLIGFKRVILLLVLPGNSVEQFNTFMWTYYNKLKFKAQVTDNYKAILSFKVIHFKIYGKKIGKNC